MAVECRYPGRVIGWLVEGSDGNLKYRKKRKSAILNNYWWLDFSHA